MKAQESDRQAFAFRKIRIGKSDIHFPRLTAYKNKKVMQAVNRQIGDATKEFGCHARSGLSGQSYYYRVFSNVEYASDGIFSIYAWESYYCGGSHPNNYNISMTFDLENGRKIEFTELFNDYDRDKHEILKIIFEKQIARADENRKSGQPRNGDCEKDPDLYSIENLEESYFVFNFSKMGLNVQPEWSHAVEYCSEGVTAPYPKLKKFAATQGILARAINKNQ